MAGLTEDHQLLGIDDDINEVSKYGVDKGILEREAEGEGKEKEGEKEMLPIHRSTSRPQLDLTGAAIQGNFEERDPTILLPNQSDDISHLALDIGGEVNSTCF